MSRALVPAWRRVELLLRAHVRPLAILFVAVVGFDALLLAGRPDAWLDVVGAALVILTAATSVILTADVVDGDLKSGMASLWFQKPVAPIRYYLGRLAETVVAVSVVVTLTVLAARLTAAGMGWSAENDLLLALPRVLLTGLLVSTIAFALSPWGSRGAVIGALIIFFAGMIIERDLAVRTEMFGPTWTPVVRALLFPETALAQVSDFVAGDSDRVWAALGRIAAHAAAWTTVGVLGVARVVGAESSSRKEAPLHIPVDEEAEECEF